MSLWCGETMGKVKLRARHRRGLGARSDAQPLKPCEQRWQDRVSRGGVVEPSEARGFGWLRAWLRAERRKRLGERMVDRPHLDVRPSLQRRRQRARLAVQVQARIGGRELDGPIEIVRAAGEEDWA